MLEIEKMGNMYTETFCTVFILFLICFKIKDFFLNIKNKTEDLYIYYQLTQPDFLGATIQLKPEAYVFFFKYTWSIHHNKLYARLWYSPQFEMTEICTHAFSGLR